MNADDIFKKYVLKTEEPAPVIKIPMGARQSGRTSRAIIGLTPGSIYVCPTMQSRMVFENMAENILNRWDPTNRRVDVDFLTIDSYISRALYTSVHVTKGEMIVFDHSVYECPFPKERYEQLMDVNLRCMTLGYNVIFDEQYYKQFHPYS